MLQIKIDTKNKYLDLSNADIPVTITNPFFSNGFSDGSFMFNFRLPTTANNSVILGFPGRLTKAYTVYNIKLECTMFWKHRFWKKGVIVITKANERNIDCSVSINESNVLALHGQKKLNSLFGEEEIDMGAGESNIQSYILNTTNSSYPDSKFCFPIYSNPSFAADSILDFSVFTEQFPFVNYYHVQGSVPKIGKLFVDSLYFGFTSPISPQIYNSYVLDKLFSNFFINNNLFKSNNELNNLMIFTNYINGQILKQTLFGYDANYFRWFNKFKIKDTLPEMLVSDYLKNLFAMFDMSFVPDRDESFSILNFAQVLDMDKVISFKNAICNIEYLDFENSVSQYNYSMKQISDGVQNNIIKDLKGLNIKGVVNTTAELSAIVNPEINDAYYIVFGNVWYVYTYITSIQELGWMLFSRNFPYQFDRTQYWEGIEIFDEPDFSVSTNAGTILNSFVTDSNVSRSMRIPTVNSVSIVNKLYETYNNKWDELAFLFYRGLQQSTEPTQPFPLAQSENYNQGQKIGNYTLAWDGVDGLFEKFHKAKFQLLKNATLFNFTPNMPESVIMNPDMTAKYYSDNILFMFKKMQFTISGSSIKNVKAEAYKL
jgi:hypothetical protein